MAPAHGDKRFHGTQTRDGERAQYLDQRTGEVVYDGPISSVTESVSETYCGFCQEWIHTNGVMGPLRFMCVHRDGDCQKGKR